MGEEYLKNGIRNLSISFVANIVTIVVTIIVTLFLPKIISVEQYGYWQVYLFYSTYVGVLHLGLNDGIYLRYGGVEYRSLDFKLFHGQFKILCIFEFIAMLMIVVISGAFCSGEYKNIWISLGICVFLTNIRYMFIYILQATNLIKEFAIVTIIDRVFFVVLVLFLCIDENANFNMIVISDLIGRCISLLVGLYFCKEIIVQHNNVNCATWNEIKKNITAGSQLMFANLASSCIIGVVRYGIQKNWSVAIFGKVSLMLSLSNFFIVFINAMGIVIYPLLRRTDCNKRNEIYFAIDKILDVVLLSFLLLYYPAKLVILWWLPQYSDVMQYICILFPIYIFEGKMALLFNTYLKVYRKEDVIFKINVLCLGISIVYTLFTTYIFKSLNLAVIGMLLMITIRCIVSQMYCSKMLNVKYKSNILSLLVGIMFYLVCGMIFNDLIGVILIFVWLIIYMCLNIRNIKKALRTMRTVGSDVM